MSRAPPLMPSSSGSHTYSSPKLGAAAIYSTSSPTGSPRPYFAQHLPGTLSPYRDASSRYAHLGSPRISSLSRDATAALKASSYPTSSSRPTSPTPARDRHRPAATAMPLMPLSLASLLQPANSTITTRANTHIRRSAGTTLPAWRLAVPATRWSRRTWHLRIGQRDVRRFSQQPQACTPAAANRYQK